MADYESLRVAIDGELAHVILERPERLNALNATALREVAEAARFLDGEAEVRVVVVEGSGGSFCSGVDVKDLAMGLFAGGKPAEESLRELHATGQAMVEAVAAMRAVTIASVRGCAIGGGVLLMAACDLRVIAEDTLLAIPEINMGLPYTWGGVPRLVQELGPSLSRELVMTGREFLPSELRASGFAHRVVAAGEVSAETDALVEQLLAKPACGLELVKRQFADASVHLMADTSNDPDWFVEAIESPDFVPAVTSYMQSRKRS